MAKEAPHSNWELARENGVVVAIGQTRYSEATSSKTEYLWEMNPPEADLVRKLLGAGPDFNPPSTWDIAPQYRCTGCDKLSGAADSVHTALEDGIHTAEMMLQVFQNPAPNLAPPRLSRCAQCNTTAPYYTGWATGSSFDWKDDDDKRMNLEI